MFESIVENLLDPSVDPVAAGMQLRELAEASIEKGPDLCDELASQAEKLRDADKAVLGGLIRVLHTSVLQPGGETAKQLNLDSLILIERRLDVDTPNRHLLLQLVAMIRSHEAVSYLADRLIEAPPLKWIEAGQILSPLMQATQWPAEVFYPKVLAALEHPALASPLLDLANYLYREEVLDSHPAANRLPALNHLLGEVGRRLGKFEEDPRSFGEEVGTVQMLLGEAVALAVSLCDSVGLIGDSSSIAKLHQVIELKHRRVQCEAASSLARLGDDLGKKRLLDLVQEPSARLRAIHCAEELGFGEDVDPEYQTDEAIAEAELCLWLCQPQQMGISPTHIEVVDKSRMLWPSFNDPVDVFLVRFEYDFGDKTYSNVGIAGPVSFASSTDVADLPMKDIYAIYAGWHADHPEIFSLPCEQLNEAQVRIMRSFSDHLLRGDYEKVSPQLFGVFLDEKAGVFSAKRAGKPCLVITDGLEMIDQPTSGRLRPFQPSDLFNLYKGRKMLRTFNPNLDSTS